MRINKPSFLYGFINGSILYYIYPLVITVIMIFLNGWNNTIVIWGTCIACAYIFMKIWVIKKNINKLKIFFFNMSIGYMAGIIFSTIILETIFLILYEHIYVYYPNLLSVNDQNGYTQIIFIKLLGLDIRGILVLIIDYLISIIMHLLCKRMTRERFS